MKDKIYLHNDKLVFCYNHDFYVKDKMIEDLQKKCINLKGFHLSLNDIIDDKKCLSIDAQYSREEQTFFTIGHVTNNYISLNQRIFNLEYNFFFEQSIFEKEIGSKYLFIYCSMYGKRENIIKTISSFAKCDCYIVSSNNINIGKNGYIPIDEFIELIKKFPTITEIQKYKKYRIDETIGDYFDNTHMYSDYISYMKKKTSMHEYFKISLNTEIDLLKYEYVQSKLKQALNDNSIDEKRWQEELMPIILLLYPRYIICLKNVKIKRTNNKDKEIDYLLVDAEGNTMILELKKPFSDKKLLTNAYRKNFYQPKFELAGGIQQIESYIYDLNYDKKENIAIINKEYEEQLKGIKINLIDVQGTLICGRSIEFDEEQKRDFEIIRKQYKNVVDIITYDELLERLNTTIRILKNQ